MLFYKLNTQLDSRIWNILDEIFNFGLCLN